MEFSFTKLEFTTFGSAFQTSVKNHRKFRPYHFWYSVTEIFAPVSSDIVLQDSKVFLCYVYFWLPSEKSPSSVPHPHCFITWLNKNQTSQWYALTGRTDTHWQSKHFFWFYNFHKEQSLCFLRFDVSREQIVTQLKINLWNVSSTWEVLCPTPGRVCAIY